MIRAALHHRHVHDLSAMHGPAGGVTHMKLTFFTKPDCTLCDSAWFVIDKIAPLFGAVVEKVDITTPAHRRWFELYKHDIPVVHLDGNEIFRHKVSETELRRLLEERR